MAKPKDTSKQEKQKMAISRGGGGSGGNLGVVVWGGVFAIATLVSVISAIKLRNKRPPTKTNHPHLPEQPPVPSSTTDACNQLEVDDNCSDSDQGEGLLVLLQENSSPPPDYHPSGDGIKDLSQIQSDPTSMDSNKSLISDIDTMLEITQPKEKPSFLDILLGDKPKPKNRSLETEDKLLQSDQFEELPKIELMGKGEEEEQENGAKIVTEVADTLQIAVQFNQEEDGAVKAPDAPQIEAEDDIKKMQLIGKGEEGQEDDGENIADTDKRVIDRTQEDQFAVEFNLDEVIRVPESFQTEAEDHPLMQLVQKEQENGENIIEMVEVVVMTGQKDQLMIELDPEAIQVMEEEKAADSSRIEAKDNSETQLIGEEKEHEHGENDEAVGTIEDNPLLRLSDEEDGDEVEEHEDGEEIAEKGEESSEETGGSSMESNAEAIWPVDSIEELSLQHEEESKTNIHKLEEKIDQYRTVETEESVCYASINKEGIQANGNYKNEDTEKSRTSLMKEVLKRIGVSMDTSNMVKLCLTVFLLVMILSHIWELP